MSTGPRSRPGSPATIHWASACAGPAGERHPRGVESGQHEVVIELRSQAHDEVVVGREALRAVIELLDAGVLHHRDPVHGVAQQDVELAPVLGQQLELERFRDLVGGNPGLGVRLEAAHQQPADLLLEIGVAIRVAQRRRRPRQPVDRLGDDVVVLGGVERDGHPDLLADGLGPLPAAIHHVLALDVTAGGGDRGDPGAIDGPAGRLRPLEDPRVQAPGPPGQRLSEVGGIDLGVVREPDRAGQVLGAHQRPHGIRLGHRDVMRLQALGARHVDGASHLHEAIGRGRDPQRAALVPTGAEADLSLQARIQLAAVEHQPGQGRVRTQLADDAGRMPGRPARQLSLLEQDHVAPAELRQVVCDATADGAAADDDDLGALREVVGGHCLAFRHCMRPPAVRVAIWANHIDLSLAPV